MTDGVNVQASLADTAKTNMEDAMATISTTINKITAEVDIVRSGWKGDAFTAFDAAANEWDGEAQKLQKCLTDIATALGDGNKSYTSIDNDNTSLFTSLYQS